MNRTNKGKRRTASSERNGLGELIRHSAIGAAIAVALCGAFCVLGGALCLLSDDPRTLTLPIALIGLYVSAFLGGRIAARLHKGAVLWCGLISGGLLAVLFWFLTLFFPHGEANTVFPISLLLRIGTVVVSMLGSILPFSAKRKRHPQKKR